MELENKVSGEKTSGLRISVCLIAKNEENYIENCIKSLLPVAHEIIVLDTGSTDRTKEICLAFNLPPKSPSLDLTANRGGLEEPLSASPSLPALRPGGELKLFETTWQDDFSIARNESIKYATGDWILFIGADEVLTEETQQNLIPFLQKNQDSGDEVVYCFKILNPQPGGLITTAYFRQAIFKNNAGIYFNRPVHEQLAHPDKVLVNINCPDLTIYHVGQLKSQDDLQNKTEKYKKQIMQAIEKNPDKNDNYYYYHHLGNAYALNNQNELALEAFQHSYNLYNESKLPKNDLVYGSVLIKLISELIYNHEDYEAALPFIEELLLISPGFPDALFYRALCLQNLDQPDEAFAIYEKLLELFSQDSDFNPLGIVSQEKSLVPVLLVEMSNISLEQADKQKGLLFLEYAYKIVPNASPVLYHLIKYHLLENNLNEAIKYYLKTNLFTEEEKKELEGKEFTIDSQDYKVNHLRLLRNLEKVEGWTPQELVRIKDKIKQLSIFVQPTISVCLITKNEEKYIEECLKSVLPVAYEIIVLDTGSTDGTREIAAKYGTVYQTTWENDFAKARNESIKYASGNWILWIDADEVLTPYTQKRLIHFLVGTKHQNEPVVFTFKNLNARPGALVDTSYSKQNLFRNNYGLYFISPIHEHLELDNGRITLIDTEFSITHSGNFRNENELAEKTKKYIDLLLKMVENDQSKKPDYFYYHHLGDSYAQIQQFDKAIEYYNLSYNLARQRDTEKFANELLITIIKELLFIHEKFADSLPFINTLAENLADFPDTYFFMAYARHQLGDLNEALNLYEKAAALYINNQLKTTEHNAVGIVLPALVLLETGRCYLQMGQKEEGLKYLEKCYQEFNNFFPVLFHLIRYHLLENNLQNAFFYFLHSGINISPTEKQRLESIALMQPNTAQYRSERLKLLQEIEHTAGFTAIELMPVKQKIKELSPKVSVCIITSNDQENIEKCLQSVLPIATEIIIVDNASTDKTENICRGLINQTPVIKFYKSRPEQDISKLKNQAFDYANGDWILTVNPNESLTPDSQKNLLPFLIEQPYQDISIAFSLKVQEKNDLFTFPLVNFKDNLFRNGFDIQSVRPVSEHLYNSEGNIALLNCPYLSLNSEKRPGEKVELTIQAILHEINLDKENSDNYYYYYYLGDAYKEAGKEQSLDAYLKAYELFNQSQLPKNNNFYGNILSKMIRELVLSKHDYQKALIFCEELLSISPTFQDALFFMGYCRQMTGDLRGALEVYEYTYDLCTRENVNPLGISSLEENIFLKLNIEAGKCYLVLGNKVKGMAYLEQIYKIVPTDKEVVIEFIKFYLSENNLKKTLEYYFVIKDNFTFNEKRSLEKTAGLPAGSDDYKNAVAKLWAEFK
jgi:glycosyltransferase involved in cell wall biosynthesis